MRILLAKGTTSNMRQLQTAVSPHTLKTGHMFLYELIYSEFLYMHVHVMAPGQRLYG